MSEKRENLVIKSVGVSEVFLLIIAVFAFAFFVGGVERVSARIIYERGDFKSSGMWENSDTGTWYRKWNTETQRSSGLYTESQFKALNDPNSDLPQQPAITPTGTESTRTKNSDVPERPESDLPGNVGGKMPQGETGKYSTKSQFFGTLTGGVAYLYEGLTMSLWVAGAIQLIGGIAGFDPGLTKSLTYGAVAGIMSAKGILSLGPKGFGIFDKTLSGTQAGLAGLVIGAAVFILTYKKTDTQKITLECLPWEAPLGGENCEVCNENELQPCSEYRCKSLGQACDIVNSGSVDEKCVWVNPNDVVPPMITPWDEPLTEGHQYANHDQLPPSLGAKIVKNPDGCLQAFTPLQFGILTDEPAQCKIDIISNSGSGEEVFDSMEYYFGDNLFDYNHTEQLSLPGPEAIKNLLNGSESPEIPTDGIYNFYVRCRDANGNFNVQEFVFQMCVDPSPDTTPPIVVDTSVVSESYVTYEVDEVNIDFYVNEPADCRWDIESKDYDELANGMGCSSEIYEINAQQLYTCSATLAGIVDRQDNNYYVRCKDQPTRPENERNVNVQSYEYILKGSQPLDIIDFGPNETVFGSTGSVAVDLTVETSNGAEEGKAICYFSSTGDGGSYVSMFETGNFEHKQTLQLTEGDYTYYYRCVDAGGNSAEESVDFRVEVDEEAPQITRAYRELDGLKVVTNEDAQCVYSLNSCNYAFEEGLTMIYSNPSIKTNHFAEWNPGITYYIKCSDDYDNQPAPNDCSLIASASNIR